MLRVVIDSCAVDPLIKPGVYEAVRAAIDAGDLEILYTHVTIEEVSDADPPRREQLLRALTALGKPVPTGALTLGTSRLGQARLTDDAGAASVHVLRSRNATNRNHNVDALVAITARFEGCALLTEEKDRLRKRATDEGIRVLNCQELFDELGLEI